MGNRRRGSPEGNQSFPSMAASGMKTGVIEIVVFVEA